MQNSLTGWHPANRIRGRLPQAIQEGRRYDELATLAWKGRFGGTGNFPANGSNQLPSWKNKVRLRGSWRTLDPWPLLRPTRGIPPSSPPPRLSTACLHVACWSSAPCDWAHRPRLRTPQQRPLFLWSSAHKPPAAQSARVRARIADEFVETEGVCC